MNIQVKFIIAYKKIITKNVNCKNVIILWKNIKIVFITNKADKYYNTKKIP